MYRCNILVFLFIAQVIANMCTIEKYRIKCLSVVNFVFVPKPEVQSASLGTSYRCDIKLSPLADGKALKSVLGSRYILYSNIYIKTKKYFIFTIIQCPVSLFSLSLVL